MLYSCGDEYYAEMEYESSFSLGVCWHERYIGTNGITLAFLEDSPVQVYGAEHYCAAQHDGTCSAAPIHDRDGKIIGVLNMAGKDWSGTLHTMGLVALAAFSIENHLTLLHSYKLVDTAISSISEGIVAVDHELCIQRINRGGEQILCSNKEKLLGRSISTWFGARYEELQSRLQKEMNPFSFAEEELLVEGHHISCNISIFPIVVEQHPEGAVLLLRRSRSVNALANQVMGNRARYVFDSIITQAPQILHTIQTMESIAATNCTVLLEGESGTGKELFAHAIHSASHRKTVRLLQSTAPPCHILLSKANYSAMKRGRLPEPLDKVILENLNLLMAEQFFWMRSENFLWKSKANFCAFWTLTESFGLEEKRKRI